MNRKWVAIFKAFDVWSSAQDRCVDLLVSHDKVGYARALKAERMLCKQLKKKVEDSGADDIFQNIVGGK